MKTDINMLISNIEHFLSDIRGPRYLYLKKLYFSVGHPVSLIFNALPPPEEKFEFNYQLTRL